MGKIDTKKSNKTKEDKPKKKTSSTPKSPKKPEFDEKEREEMIQRRRDRRRTERKKEKEFKARLNQKKRENKKPSKGGAKDIKGIKLTSKTFKKGDAVRVVNLNGIKVKYQGIIRWIGVLDENKNNKQDQQKKKKEKKTFGVELLENEGENDGTYKGKRYFFTKDGKKTGVFIK